MREDGGTLWVKGYAAGKQSQQGEIDYLRSEVERLDLEIAKLQQELEYIRSPLLPRDDSASLIEHLRAIRWQQDNEIEQLKLIDKDALIRQLKEQNEYQRVLIDTMESVLTSDPAKAEEILTNFINKGGVNPLISQVKTRPPPPPSSKLQVELDDNLNEAGWEMYQALCMQGPVTEAQFNAMKSILQTVIKNWLTRKGQE